MLRKKRFSLFMFFVLLFTVIPIEAYAYDIPFTDVKSGDWFYDDVKTAYVKELINGKTSTTYAPNDNMTAAEAVKLASCIHQLKNEGKVDFASDNPWYSPYVAYAKKHKLLSEDLDWNQDISRAGYMQIFAQILSADDAKKNNIPDNSIPDVPMSHPNASAIYKLYKAGIVQGVDAAHNCNPASFIKRSEVAAIVVRMTDSTRCITFNLDKVDNTSEVSDLTVTKQPESVKGNVGETVKLEVEVKGGKAPLKYQWQHKECGTQYYNDSKAEGNKTNILKPVVESKNHDYICIITDANGKSVNSAIVTVFSDSAAPIITKQPIGAAGKLDEYVKLEVIAEGGKAPLKYQWQCAAADSSDFYNSKAKGNTSNILEPKVESNAYDYRCVITDAKGKSVTSNIARVTENIYLNPPVVIKQPEGFQGNVGDTAKLKVIVEGGKAPLKYLWKYSEYGTSTYHDSKAPGNMSDVLRPRVEEKIYDYYCVIIDADGKSVKSNSARVEKTVEIINI